MTRASIGPTARPVRVLHLVSSLHIGGVGRLLVQNVAHLDRSAVESVVGYLVPIGDLVPEFLAKGLEPVSLEHTSGQTASRTLTKLVRLIKEQQIDIIHTHLALDRILGSLAAAVTRRPVVTTLHSTGSPDNRRSRIAFTEDILSRWTTRRFIAVSKAVRDYQVGTRRIPVDRIEVLYSGVDIDEFSPEHVKDRVLAQAIGVSDRFPILINVARLVPFKGQRRLIEVMPLLLRDYPRAHLLLVGEGGERRSLEEAIQSRALNDHVSLLGKRGDIPELLALADIFLFPTSSGEGLGIAALEAMAAGKPIVATDIPPLDEVVSNGKNGFLVRDGDPAGIARAVGRILGTRDLLEVMGKSSRRIALERFDIRASVRRLAEIYLEVAPPEVTH